jgi:preprotein translocase subunit SecB
MANQDYSLLNIILLESTFKREWILNIDNPNVKNNTNINVSANTGPDNLNVIVELKFETLVDEKVEVVANIKMVGIFTAVDKPELPIEKFININAPAIIFPFIREHLASISVKAGMNVVMLQPVNFTKIP